jgi:MSHA pilin protein MshC
MVVNTAIPLFYFGRAKERGFTMIEMIAVIAIVAVLSVVATSMFSKTAWDTIQFGRQLEAALAFAQKSAVAQRRTVTVTVAAGSATFTICSSFNPCCASVALPLPAQGGGSVLTAPSGVTLSPATTVAFTAGGGTSPAGTQTITVSGDGSYAVTVEGGTAYVHP